MQVGGGQRWKRGLRVDSVSSRGGGGLSIPVTGVRSRPLKRGWDEASWDGGRESKGWSHVRKALKKATQNELRTSSSGSTALGGLSEDAGESRVRAGQAVAGLEHEANV